MVPEFQIISEQEVKNCQIRLIFKNLLQKTSARSKQKAVS
jgi:hypothetical protein